MGETKEAFVAQLDSIAHCDDSKDLIELLYQPIAYYFTEGYDGELTQAQVEAYVANLEKAVGAGVRHNDDLGGYLGAIAARYDGEVLAQDDLPPPNIAKQGKSAPSAAETESGLSKEQLDSILASKSASEIYYRVTDDKVSSAVIHSQHAFQTGIKIALDMKTKDRDVITSVMSLSLHLHQCHRGKNAGVEKTHFPSREQSTQPQPKQEISNKNELIAHLNTSTNFIDDLRSLQSTETLLTMQMCTSLGVKPGEQQSLCVLAQSIQEYISEDAEKLSPEAMAGLNKAVKGKMPAMARVKNERR